MSCKIVQATSEELIAYIARVSNPNNQNNTETAGKLLSYCLRNEHWSVFEHGFMTIEVKTTRAIAAQILRHRSFCFQEFSTRYAQVTERAKAPAFRAQDTKNRQSSHDTLPILVLDGLRLRADKLIEDSFAFYDEMVAMGVAKETARDILPLCTPTTIYVSGNIRSWIHYTSLRTKPGTQKEHRDIAVECHEILKSNFPMVANALEIASANADWVAKVCAEARANMDASGK